MSAPSAGRSVLLCGGDACFVRMLAYELTRAGCHVTEEGEPADCAVVDLDSGGPVSVGLPAVGYTRTGKTDPRYASVLARPFAIPALLDALGHLERSVEAGENDTHSLRRDDASRTVILGRSRLTLMPAEYALLCCLLDAGGQPVSRAGLIAALPSGNTPTSNLAEVTVCALRRKLEAAFGIRPDPHGARRGVSV